MEDLKLDKEQNRARGVLALKRDHVRFGGMLLEYTLSVREGVPANRFEIGVRMDREESVTDAGDELEFALESYRKLVSGIVTPCTVGDVMQDLEYSRKKLQKKLYKRSFM